MLFDDYVSIIKERTGLEHDVIASVLNSIAPAIIHAKNNGEEKIRINNMGTFSLRQRSAKKLHDVTTNQMRIYAGYTTLFFSPDKRFLDNLNKENALLSPEYRV